MTTAPTPARGAAHAVMAAGVLLFGAGCLATFSYLGLPLLMPEALGSQLGTVAAMALGLLGGLAGLLHGRRAAQGHASEPARLPPAFTFGLGFALVLGLGNLLLLTGLSANYLFPLVFVLGAALPTAGVLAWAARRLGWPVTWRQVCLALLAGSTLSVAVALFLETLLPYLVFQLVPSLGFLLELLNEWLFFSNGGLIERLLFSPMLIVFLVVTALAAPIPEEFAKALGLLIFGRGRITNERQALMVGLALGAGFAILENMLYEGLYAQLNGWTWGGVTLLRGLGAVLHPLCTGLVALGWFRARERGLGQWLRAYALAVGLHTVWNGGFFAFIYLTGLDYYAGAGPSLSLYGTAVEWLLLVFLAVLALALWGVLTRLTAGPAQASEVELVPVQISPRALAGWAVACVLIIVPIGAALGPAWGALQRALVTGS